MTFTTRILSQRGVRPTVPRCMGYEFEDRAVELLGAQLVAPTHGRGSERRENMVKGAAKRLRRAARVSPGYAGLGPSVDPDAPTDLLVMHCQFPGDTLLLHATPRWRSRTGKAIAYVEEVWLATIDSWGGHLDTLGQFDQVFIGHSWPAAALAERIDTPVDYLPFGVDLTRFGPADPLRERPIDVLNVGRRSAVTHRALLEWSIADDRFYYFDSFTPKRCHDLAEHRIMYSRLQQHARFSISNRGVGAANVANEGEASLPARYFEAAAAGSVLVGDPPDAPELASEFGWTDAIVPAPFDAPELPDLVTTLAADRARVDAIRLRNVEECLRRHDWAHRLRTMLASVELDEPPTVTERITALGRRADELATRRAALS